VDKSSDYMQETSMDSIA